MSEEMVTCEVCQGSGWNGHPDSGELCYKCKGAGGYPRGDDGTALALYIELGAYFDPKLTEHDKSIVLSKIRSRTSSSQSRLSEAVKVLEPFGKLEMWSDGADDADIVIMTVGTIRKVRQFLATLGEEQ